MKAHALISHMNPRTGSDGWVLNFDAHPAVIFHLRLIVESFVETRYEVHAYTREDDRPLYYWRSWLGATLSDVIEHCEGWLLWNYERDTTHVAQAGDWQRGDFAKLDGEGIVVIVDVYGEDWGMNQRVRFLRLDGKSKGTLAVPSEKLHLECRNTRTTEITRVFDTGSELLMRITGDLGFYYMLTPLRGANYGKYDMTAYTDSGDPKRYWDGVPNLHSATVLAQTWAKKREED